MTVRGISGSFRCNECKRVWDTNLCEDACTSRFEVANGGDPTLPEDIEWICDYCRWDQSQERIDDERKHDLLRSLSLLIRPYVRSRPRAGRVAEVVLDQLKKEGIL